MIKIYNITLFLANKKNNIDKIFHKIIKYIIPNKQGVKNEHKGLSSYKEYDNENV